MGETNNSITQEDDQQSGSRLEDTSTVGGPKVQLNSQRSWYYSTMYPSHKERRREFRNLFSSSSEEKFVVDYSCAYHKDILHQGRMYVTSNSCYFYSYIFGWENKLEIPWDQVVTITKEKTAIFIPNAVQVTTADNKFFFASFADRDSSFMMLVRLWQATVTKQLLSDDDVHQIIACEYGEGESVNISDDSGDEVIKEGDEVNKEIEAEEESEVVYTPEVRSLLDNWRTNGEDNTTLVSVCDRVVNRSLSELYNLLYSNSNFYFDFQKDRGTTELEVGEWVDQEQVGTVREVSYNMSLNNPVGPKKCQVKETQTLTSNSITDSIYFIQCEAENSGVPYADSFIVVTNSCLIDEGSGKSRLLARAEIRFKKDIWSFLRDKIESNAWTGIKTYYTQLVSSLDTYSESQPQQASKTDKISSSKRGGDLPESSFMTRVSNPILLVSILALFILCILNTTAVYRLSNLAEVEYLPFQDRESFPDDQAGWVKLLLRQATRHSSHHTNLREKMLKTSTHIGQVQNLLDEMSKYLTEVEKEERGWIEYLTKCEEGDVCNTKEEIKEEL